jgi:hypothetical protein
MFQRQTVCGTRFGGVKLPFDDRSIAGVILRIDTRQNPSQAILHHGRLVLHRLGDQRNGGSRIRPDTGQYKRSSDPRPSRFVSERINQDGYRFLAHRGQGRHGRDANPGLFVAKLPDQCRYRGLGVGSQHG